MTHAHVVGAGVSGLIAAWCLADAGWRVTVSEAEATPGGLVRTMRTAEGLVERGPNALRWTDTTARWFERLGLAPTFPHELHRRRYVHRNGRPRRWPLSPAESAAAAARLAGAAVTGRLRPQNGERVSTFVSRVAGQAASTWLVGPMLQGIYAAPPDRLAAQAVFRGRSQTTKSRGLAAPAGGMGELINRLVRRLEDRGVEFAWSTPVHALETGKPTVICTNAPHAARLLAGVAAAAASAVARISMSDAASVTAFFERDRGDLQGFGVLLPEPDGFRALGVVFNDCLFDGRSPLHRSETWIFRGASAGLDDEGLVAAIAADRERMTRRRDRPVAAYVSRYRDALPVYDSAVIEGQGTVAALPPWLAVTGNYLGRIGLADLIEQAEGAAARLVRQQQFGATARP